jgi:putative SOS response-associated peptidase YedK
MCGRFTLRSSPQAVAEAFGLPEIPELLPRFNIAPGQPVAVVRQEPRAEGRQLVLLRWGLIPAWADDPSIGDRLANARSETAATKPSFRRAFRSRRCLVVADGFYEWRRANGRKQPSFVGLPSDRPFGLAGRWERWEKHGEPVESCTILSSSYLCGSCCKVSHSALFCTWPGAEKSLEGLPGKKSPGGLLSGWKGKFDADTPLRP